MTLKEKLAANEAAQDRWLTKLTRATNAINKLRQQRKRLLKKAAKSSQIVKAGGNRHILVEG